MKCVLKNRELLLQKLLEMMKVEEHELPLKKKDLYSSAETRKMLNFYHFVKRLKLTYWNPKWVEMLNDGAGLYMLNPQVEFLSETRATLELNLRPSFFTFLEGGLSKARSLLKLKKVSHEVKTSCEKAHGVDILFENLNPLFDLKTDHVCNIEDTFFLNPRLVLPTQSTPLTLVEKTPDILDSFKVFRRESTDKTHLTQFHQVEFRKVYKGGEPLKELITCAKLLLGCFGLDPCRLEVRSTRYTYTSPSIEVFYKEDDGSMKEVLGGGIFRPFLVKRYNLAREDQYVLAAALGAERLYMIKNRLNRVKSCYNVVP